MAKNHSIMCIILDFVDFNPPSVPSFPKYFNFSYIQVLYIPGYLCGPFIIVSDQLYFFLRGSSEPHTILQCQASTRVTSDIMNIWVSLWISFFNNCWCFGCLVHFCACGDCMLLPSKTTNTFLWVVKANLESVIMYMQRWKYFHHIHHFALNNSYFHQHWSYRYPWV